MNEEPRLDIDSHKSGDKVIFHIVNRIGTLKDITRYYNNERYNLTLLQYSILLNKFNTLLRMGKDAYDEHSEVLEAQTTMTKVASHLIDNLKDLDATTVLHLLKVCAYADKTMSFSPSYENLT